VLLLHANIRNLASTTMILQSMRHNPHFFLVLVSFVQMNSLTAWDARLAQSRFHV